MNSLPETVTRQSRGCDLNAAPESSTLTTRLPSHPLTEYWGYMNFSVTITITTYERVDVSLPLPSPLLVRTTRRTLRAVPRSTANQGSS